MPRTRKVIIREMEKLLKNVEVWKQLVQDYSGRINDDIDDEENKETRMPLNIKEAYQTMIDAALKLISKLEEEIDEQNPKTAINVDEINTQKEETNEETNEEAEPATTVEMGGGKRQKKRKSKKQMKKRKSGKKTRRSKK